MSSTFRERENYNCIMEIMNVAVCEGLRKIFKEKWDKHYGNSKGMWDDSTLTGNELYNMERPRTGAKDYLLLFKSGNRNEWDLSALFDAILYSRAIKMHLSPHVSNKVDELRIIRNDLIHSFGSQHKMSDVALQNAYKKIISCFKVLKLSTEGIERIRNSSKENRKTRSRKLIVFVTTIFVAFISIVSYYWVAKPLEPETQFRVLPTQPIHLIANRSQTVEAFLEVLYNLSLRNNRAMTYMYITGNPGSGKSQLARLVGQRYGTNTPSRSFGSNIFVMTLSGRSENDIYSSYVDFARRLGCKETDLASIMNSNQTKTATKIQSLKTKIAIELKNFENKHIWLLIVDNVVKLNEISSFLPQLNDEDWKGGQVLITTQDKPSVPPNNSLIVHISVSEGMNPVESCEFLTRLSRLVESENSVRKVAKELDFQPLALASAAFYVKQLRESKVSFDFSWKDYLQKLNEGKRNLTETKLSEVNQAYSLTMTTAVLLAVKMIAESDPVLKHAFTFLSYVSNEPQALEVVVSYVLRVENEQDKDDVGLRIRKCSLVLPLDDEKVISIAIHRVVHDSIKLYIAPDAEENTKSRIPLYVLQSLLRQKCALGEIALIPHLRSFYAKTKNCSSALVPGSLKVKQEMQKQIFDLTSVWLRNGKFLLTKNFLILALKIATKERHQDRMNSVHTHFPKIGEIYCNLGITEMTLGNVKQARKYLKEALSIFLKQHGPSHKNVAKCYIHLASLDCSTPQECSENEKYYELALKIDNNPETEGIYLANLGRRYYNEGDLERARIFFVEANNIFGKILGVCTDLLELKVTSSRLALIWTNLGAIDYRLGYFKNSKILLKRSINIYKKVIEPNHLDLGNSYFNLGLVHLELNELDEAEECFRRALEIFKRQLKPDHERIKRVSQNLVDVLKKTGQLKEAGVLEKKYGTCACPMH